MTKNKTMKLLIKSLFIRDLIKGNLYDPISGSYLFYLYCITKQNVLRFCRK